LTNIIEAMKNNHVVKLTYRSFIHGTFHTFSAKPYCLKMFQKRWYLLARNLDDNCLRIYGLDRLENLDEMGEDIGLQWSIQNSTDNVVEVLYLYEPKV
jgi:predicted DNA-binding transcriptional regulator YafY